MNKENEEMEETFIMSFLKKEFKSVCIYLRE